MLDYVRYLDETGSKYGSANRGPYAVDAMNWYVRLAKLEEKNNGGEQEEYVREACRRCEEMGRTDCKKERLSEEVDRMDRIALAQLKKR